MIQDKQIALSTEEFVAALVLCGYEEAAADIINELQLAETEEQLVTFSNQAETLLNNRGYWDETRSSNLVKGLESFIHLLIKSQKKTRCVHGNHVLIFHQIEGDEMIVQTFKGMEHRFELCKHSDSLWERMADFFGLADEDVDLPENFRLRSQGFDLFSQATSEEIDAIIRDQIYPENFNIFLDDFRNHGFSLDNISMMISHYTRDESELIQVNFFLKSSKGFMWYVDYSLIEETNEIHVKALAPKECFEAAVYVMLDFYKHDAVE
ncbi:hypothetical protein CAY60_003880 [Shouchella clausii]|uniref:Uncharacterized protein n=3 Tax=Shouchella TaxID=2893057 RepID=Q5WKM2_SHOC1|nr:MULTISPECIES: hypothetical protein [Shouchella]MCM3314520.1 hypothetical protein [Psychrobacillus sp. MER TA 17]PAD44370.1 hypothetical protein CHH54_01820 [Bacillus sp. 7520-S]SPT79255.1 Uncharacterised protein [Niallia circulans]ALA52321.1 hypothetical protein DB29_01493 [Shouchella clausii]KKI88367.1 hypothetical protein WZ76_00950 [Shouchella clausii]